MNKSRRLSTRTRPVRWYCNRCDAPLPQLQLDEKRPYDSRGVQVYDDGAIATMGAKTFCGHCANKVRFPVHPSHARNLVRKANNNG